MSESVAVASAATNQRPPDLPRRGKGRPTEAQLAAIPDDYVEVLVERLDDGMTCGLLPRDLDLFKRILAALFPEHFHRELPLAKTASDTEPFSDERIHLWAARMKQGKCPWHPDDSPTRAITPARQPVRRRKVA